MRGILYPASNVIFAAQEDITKLPVAADPSVSPNPLTSTYGGCVIEAGPDSFLASKPQALALCAELGLSDRLIGTPATRR